MENDGVDRRAWSPPYFVSDSVQLQRKVDSVDVWAKILIGFGVFTLFSAGIFSIADYSRDIQEEAQRLAAKACTDSGWRPYREVYVTGGGKNRTTHWAAFCVDAKGLVHFPAGSASFEN